MIQMLAKRGVMRAFRSSLRPGPPGDGRLSAAHLRDKPEADHRVNRHTPEPCPMQQRTIGPFSVSAIGLGCMNLNHAYGPPPPPDVGAQVLRRALDLGVTFFDTAALYGWGRNESLIGDTLAAHRDQFVLASKCGMTAVNGERVIDGRPETITRTCEESLQRLRTDVIDLYYLHRLDPHVPVEESVGAMAGLVRAGKVRTLGLSEVSAATLRRAHAVHPVAAVQTEYSLWTRNPEIAVLDTCRAIGATFVAFSPVARGFLTGRLRDVSTLHARDLRLTMPRFYPDNYGRNLVLLDAYERIAARAGCTPAQFALGWLLAKAPHIVPIPGTADCAHLEENMGAAAVTLDPGLIAEAEALINQRTVAGARYNPQVQRDIDTEEFG